VAEDDEDDAPEIINAPGRPATIEADVYLGVRIPTALHAALKARSETERIGMSEVVRAALLEYL